MQKVASSIGFLEQALYYQFTPTFAKLKGHVISSINKKQVDKKFTKKHLFEHRNNLKHLRGRHYNIINELLKLVGKVILRIYKAKNKKIRNRRPKHANKTSQVPVKKLSNRYV